MLAGVRYYADAEGGAYLEDPTKNDLIGLIEDLVERGNSFVIVFPDDDDLPWSVATEIGRGPFGGYTITYEDTRTKTPPAATTATSAADQVLTWANVAADFRNKP